MTRNTESLRFRKNIVDFAADIYTAIGNNWMLFPPHLSFDSIPRSGMEFIELETIHEDENSEDRAQRYHHGLNGSSQRNRRRFSLSLRTICGL